MKQKSARKRSIRMSSHSGRVQRRGLKSEAAYNRLRAKIVSCEMPPGSTFNESDIIAETGFGRTPVREALAQLAHDGLVEILPRSGYRVTELNEKAVRDLFIVWRTIAPLIIFLASKASQARKARYAAHVSRLRLAQAKGFPPEETAKIGSGFDILADSTNNAELIKIYRRLRGQMDRVYALFLATPRGAEWARNVNSNAAIFLQPDHDATVKRVLEYIDDSLAGIIESLEPKKRKVA